MVKVGSGIWKISFGKPEDHTPTSLNIENIKIEALSQMTEVADAPFTLDKIKFQTNARGCAVEIPMDGNEQIYGLGMRLPSLNVTGTRKSVVVTDSPEQKDGSGHAPVPFYVSTKGYGVFVDTLRYARFYCGNLSKVNGSGRQITVDIPTAKGVDVYIFSGPTILDAVRRYNLFSGGGCLPPLWGLGIYYRGYGSYNSEEVIGLAREFRENHIPCDVFGLEPGWHSHAYSCSYVWSGDRWPEPDKFISEMQNMGYQLNLWEHAFVHPTAPFHEAIKPHSGDYIVWGGLVPDFAVPDACKIFTEHHEREFVKKGILSFKLDECDNQPQHDHPWSFPEISKFPSGMDGEQMHSLFGLAYQRALEEMFRRNNIRTYGQVRSSHALASSMPFVLYSDAYDHKSFVRGILNCGFSGVLWQPELRVASSVAELYRRIETVIFSPQAIINAWFMPHPPWDQINSERNKNHELMADREEIAKNVKKLFEIRMSLIPYLYSAFADYHYNGTPPFRALVMDYPDDEKTYDLDDEYMMGESLLVAPIFGNDTKRVVYLPDGNWYCFWTHKKYSGGQEYEIEMPPEKIPVFVKEGALLPIAKPLEKVGEDTCFEVDVYAFGPNCRNFLLYEDDGISFDFSSGSQNKVILTYHEEEGNIQRQGNYAGKRYSIVSWRAIR